jgi:hypothetical protein
MYLSTVVKEKRKITPSIVCPFFSENLETSAHARWTAWIASVAAVVIVDTASTRETTAVARSTLFTRWTVRDIFASLLIGGRRQTTEEKSSDGEN